jgi:hypothetical protein
MFSGNRRMPKHPLPVEARALLWLDALPAPGCALADANRAFARVLPGIFAVFLLLDQAFLVAGYWVV